MGNNNVKEKHESSDKDRIQILARQAARWSVAAEQDENPLIGVLHANYGAGYLWALRDTYSQNEIEEAMGGDFTLERFMKDITRIQDTKSKQMLMICPDMGDLDKSRFLKSISGEGFSVSESIDKQ